MNTKQQGFTLVELVVVIVILGILAATAIPKFINLTHDARTSAVQGAAGGLRAAVALVQARYQASGASGASVTMADTTTVTVGTTGIAAGVPVGTTAGIGAAMNCESSTACQGLILALVSGGASTFWPSSGGSATCQVSYTDTTGAIVVSTGGC